MRELNSGVALRLLASIDNKNSCYSAIFSPCLHLLTFVIYRCCVVLCSLSSSPPTYKHQLFSSIAFLGLIFSFSQFFLNVERGSI